MNGVLGQVLMSAVPNVEQQWATTFFGLDQDQRFVLLLVAIGCATGILLGLAGIVAGAVGSAYRRRTEAELKRDMLDRGMSSEEITRVIEASPPRDWLDRWAAASKKS